MRHGRAVDIDSPPSSGAIHDHSSLITHDNALNILHLRLEECHKRDVVECFGIISIDSNSSLMPSGNTGDIFQCGDLGIFLGDHRVIGVGGGVQSGILILGELHGIKCGRRRSFSCRL